ncbi:MAG: hypothetical protein JWR80_9989 [Bradyrhizobium sp.]|nr:hypothetical protein [Bradyrhizobium sp.]
MLTLSTIAAWLSSFAGGVIVKLLVDGFSAWMGQRQADANAKEVGQLQAANKINAETVETQDAMDGVARPSDDAVANSLRTGKF